MKFLKVFYLVPWSIAFFGMIWLFVQRFPPSGIVSFDIPFDGSSAWMDPFLPAERVTSPGLQEDGWTGQSILQEPVYSAARVPGVYDTLTLDIEFRPNDQSLLEFGILRDEASLSFEFQPLWYAPLQSNAWIEAETEDGYEGFVRRGESASILETSQYATLGLWYASSVPAIMRDEPSDVMHETIVSLRGAHDFWILPAGDVIDFEIDIQDSNRRKGLDSVAVRIQKGDEIIYTDAIGVGGSRDEAMGKVVSKHLHLDGLEPGVYRVRIIAEDDVFIRGIRTTSKRFVVGPRLVFGDVVGYATSSQSAIAWSNSRHLILETFHIEGLQDVSFGKDVMTLAETHEQYHLQRTDRSPLPQKFSAPAGDIRIVGDGFFSFTPEAFFVPQPRRLTVFTDPDAEEIVGIVTPYERPIDLGDGWYRGRVIYTLDPSRDHSRFALSAPGLFAEEGAVDIRQVTLTYQRPRLDWKEWFRVVRQELANAWHRLRE